MDRKTDIRASLRSKYQTTTGLDCCW